jgi:hypothetical protein
MGANTKLEHVLHFSSTIIFFRHHLQEKHHTDPTECWKFVVRKYFSFGRKKNAIKGFYFCCSSASAILCHQKSLSSDLRYWLGILGHKWVICAVQSGQFLPFNGDHVSRRRRRRGDLLPGKMCVSRSPFAIRRRDAESVLCMSPSHAWNGFRVHEPSEHLIAITAASIVTSLIRNCYY